MSEIRLVPRTQLEFLSAARASERRRGLWPGLFGKAPHKLSCSARRISCWEGAGRAKAHPAGRMRGAGAEPALTEGPASPGLGLGSVEDSSGRAGLPHRVLGAALSLEAVILRVGKCSPRGFAAVLSQRSRKQPQPRPLQHAEHFVCPKLAL